MPPEAGTITNLIRRQRFDHGEMTQQSLVERVGVMRLTIISLEAGRYASVPGVGIPAGQGVRPRGRLWLPGTG
jgi:hypothetical protein